MIKQPDCQDSIVTKIFLKHFNAEQKFSNVLFHVSVNVWHKLYPVMRRTKSHSLIRKELLEFIRITRNITYRIHDVLGMKL